MFDKTLISIFDKNLQTKYDLPPDAHLVTILEMIEDRVDKAIWSAQDDPMWPDLIKDYREIQNQIDLYNGEIFQIVCNF